MTMLSEDTQITVVTDARKLRSREAIYAAFLVLLEEKAIDQISIREIATKAGVGHATFYRHYPSKEALLKNLAADEIRRLVNLTMPTSDTPYSSSACLVLCNHINDHRRLWTTLLTGGAAGTLKEELLRISRDVATVQKGVFDGRIPLELRVQLSVSSLVETLSWWLRQTNPVPASDVARYIDRLIMSYS